MTVDISGGHPRVRQAWTEYRGAELPVGLADNLQNGRVESTWYGATNLLSRCRLGCPQRILDDAVSRSRAVDV